MIDNLEADTSSEVTEMSQVSNIFSLIHYLSFLLKHEIFLNLSEDGVEHSASQYLSNKVSVTDDLGTFEAGDMTDMFDDMTEMSQVRNIFSLG
ncbi:MAG TPA: hypothetical protein EYO76_06200 [Flavobacteriaceae bacterium]|nr:hypothetical protein [Flavobacteriaceae bacterium]